LAKRGIVTSTVGIGDDYEGRILRAIAENSGGRLHDAERGTDIVDVLAGELGEIGGVAAQDVTVTLSVPGTARVKLIGSAPSTVGVGSLTVLAGTLLAGRPRQLVFRIALPSGQAGESLLFGVTARGTSPTGAALEGTPTEVALKFAVGAINGPQPRDITTSLIVARAWHANIVRTVASMNRSGDRRHARHYVERQLRYFERYCDGLLEARELAREIALLKRNIDRSWDERTRKEMELGSYLAEANRDDHRSAARASWVARMQQSNADRPDSYGRKA
jgi:Ca-activated chloride channel family protein